jgi:hypothetical protein
MAKASQDPSLEEKRSFRLTSAMVTNALERRSLVLKNNYIEHYVVSCEITNFFLKAKNV